MKLNFLAFYSSGALALGCLLPLASRGADDAKNAGVESGHLSPPDEKFVMSAAQGGMTEVKLGELADQKARRDDVKKFGQRMMEDHGKGNDALKSLATKKSLNLPEQLDATHAGTIDRLSKLEGDQFDKAYIDEMIKDHKTDIEEFEEAGKTTKDAELKVFIAKTLPTLRSHLSHIQGIEESKAK
jgi:putative membrane protein